MRSFCRGIKQGYESGEPYALWKGEEAQEPAVLGWRFSPATSSLRPWSSGSPAQAMRNCIPEHSELFQRTRNALAEHTGMSSCSSYRACAAWSLSQGQGRGSRKFRPQYFEVAQLLLLLRSMPVMAFKFLYAEQMHIPMFIFSQWNPCPCVC